jgi:6-phosphogluconolactonase
MMVSPDNKFLYISDVGNDRVVWYERDLITGKLIKKSELFLVAGAAPQNISISPNCEYLFVNSLGNTLPCLNAYKRDVITGDLTYLWDNGIYDTGTAVSIARNNKYIYSSIMNDFHVYEMDLNTNKIKLIQVILTVGRDDYTSSLVSNDNKYLYYANDDFGDFIIYEIQSDGKLKEKNIFSGTYAKDFIVLSPDDRFIYISGWSQSIIDCYERRWD